MILKKTSVLGSLLVAVRKGKRVKEILTLNTDEKTVRLVTGKTLEVDYFVAVKPPSYMKKQLGGLGIESTRDVRSFIKRKEKVLLQESQQSAA